MRLAGGSRDRQKLERFVSCSVVREGPCEEEVRKRVVLEVMPESDHVSPLAVTSQAAQVDPSLHWRDRLLSGLDGNYTVIKLFGSFEKPLRT